MHTHTHTDHQQQEVRRDVGRVGGARTDIDEVVEEAGVQRLGQGVPGEAGLLGVQGDGDGLGLPAPLAVHRPAGQFAAEAVLRDAQQEGRERQD